MDMFDSIDREPQISEQRIQNPDFHLMTHSPTTGGREPRARNSLKFHSASQNLLDHHHEWTMGVRQTRSKRPQLDLFIEKSSLNYRDAFVDGSLPSDPVDYDQARVNHCQHKIRAARSLLGCRR